MTFIIGSITLPYDPGQAVFRFRTNAKKIALLKQLPFLLSLGPKVPVLRLKGYIAEAGKDADQLETDYLIPLRDMIWKPAAYPRILGDDNMISGGNWAGIGWVLEA